MPCQKTHQEMIRRYPTLMCGAALSLPAILAVILRGPPPSRSVRMRPPIRLHGPKRRHAMRGSAVRDQIKGSFAAIAKVDWLE